jgi:hypothetical protein
MRLVFRQESSENLGKEQVFNLGLLAHVPWGQKAKRQVRDNCDLSFRQEITIRNRNYSTPSFDTHNITALKKNQNEQHQTLS